MKPSGVQDDILRVLRGTDGLASTSVAKALPQWPRVKVHKALSNMARDGKLRVIDTQPTGGPRDANIYVCRDADG